MPSTDLRYLTIEYLYTSTERIITIARGCYIVEDSPDNSPDVNNLVRRLHRLAIVVASC